MQDLRGLGKGATRLHLYRALRATACVLGLRLA